jgi:hypothetical protein
MSDKSKIYDYIKRTINPYGKPFEGTAYELGLKIMDYIENMDDEKENGWIPVSERLPEIKQNYEECYLVTDGRFCWMAYWTPEKEWVFAECTDCKNKIDWTDVVAWMPLPEPYKEGRS